MPGASCRARLAASAAATAAAASSSAAFLRAASAAAAAAASSSSAADATARLAAAEELVGDTLESALEFIDEDERVEITPTAIRLRKSVLAGNQRSIVRGERRTED